MQTPNGREQEKKDLQDNDRKSEEIGDKKAHDTSAKHGVEGTQ